MITIGEVIQELQFVQQLLQYKEDTAASRRLLIACEHLLEVQDHLAERLNASSELKTIICQKRKLKTK